MFAIFLDKFDYSTYDGDNEIYVQVLQFSFIHSTSCTILCKDICPERSKFLKLTNLRAFNFDPNVSNVALYNNEEDSGNNRRWSGSTRREIVYKV